MGRRREKPPEEIPTPTGPVKIGSLVRYYRNGWYHGYLETTGGASVSIKPVGPKFGAAPRSVIVPIEDIQAT